MKQSAKRIGAVLLAAALLIGQPGTTAYATEPITDSGGLGTVSGNTIPQPVKPEGTEEITITAFDELDDAVRFQTVPAGTTLDKLNLPATLSASGYTVDEDSDPVPKPISITGVVWEPTGKNNSPAEYGEERSTPSIYYFQPILPEGYRLAEAAVLPEIEVCCILYNMAGRAGTGNYHDGDVKAFKAILDMHPSLKSSPGLSEDDPSSWETAGLVVWDRSSQRRIIKLSLYDKGLTGVLDVKDLTALKSLSCGNNLLSMLDMGNLTALTSLSCSNNQLSMLDVGNLTALTSLSCSDNRLYKLDVKNLTALEDLRCSTNQLSTLDVGNLTALTILTCYSNQLSMLDVRSLTSLDHLSCFDNLLEELDMRNLTALTSLNCNNNPFTSFTATDGHTLTITPSTGGKIWLTKFDKDSNQVLLAAEPDTGYVFNTWNGLPAGTSSTMNIADFTLSRDETVAAVFRPLRTDATLKTLSLSAGTLTPAFDPAVTSYTAAVDNSVSNISITAGANDSGAAVIGDGAHALNVGSNTFTLTVTAEDGSTKKEYTVTVTRAAPDATLKSLSLSAGTLSPSFDPAVTSYTAAVDSSVSGVTITAGANDSGAEVTGDGAHALNVGSNTFTLTVTAGDGSTKKEYTVTITRAAPAASTDATLKILSLSVGTLSPSFDPAVTSYTAAVDNSVSNINIIAGANDSRAAVTGDGAHALNVGSNTFTLTVTAGDGSTKKKYTVTITRAAPAASTDATLKSLSLSVGTLSPSFDPAVTSYTAAVDNSVSNINITAGANDSGAAVTGDGAHALNVGSNAFPLTVTAGDGSTKKEYTVTITRAEAITPDGGSSSGGSSGGGNSSGSPSSSPMTTTPQPPKPNTPVLAVIELPVTVGNGTATGRPDDERTAEAISEVQRNNRAKANGIAIQYDAKASTACDGFSIVIAQATLDRLIAAGVKYVTLNTDTVDLTLDLAALQEIQKQSTGDITLTATRETGLTGDMLAAVGSRPAYRLAVNYTGKDGKAAAVRNFGTGRVTVGLAYKPAATEQTGSLFLVYSKDTKNTEWLYQSGYDHGSGNVAASTGHFSLFGVGYKPAPAFTDTVSHWAKADIDFAASRGLLTGTGKTTFTPDGTITRGMLAAALGRLAGADPAAYPSRRFSDVAADAGYAPYVEWAVSGGIISGTGEQTFSPDDAITREQMAAIMQRYADKLGYTLPVAHEAEIFADGGQITGSMKNAVQAMQQAGIMNSKDGRRFCPRDTTTRAEAAAVLQRFVKTAIAPAGAMAVSTIIDGCETGSDGVRK